MIIDTHLHVWSDDSERYPFAEGRTQVGGGSVELLNQTMDEVGVDKAVIVQPIYYLFDNRYVADCLRRFPGRFAAIGLVDPKAPDAADRLEKLVREDDFGGLRIHSSRLDHPLGMGRPRPRSAVAAVGGTGHLFYCPRPGGQSAPLGAYHRPLSRGAGGVGPHRWGTDQ